MLTIADYKKSINEDITNGEDIEILYEDDLCITVYDETELCGREYTIYDPSYIATNPNWLMDRIIITPAAEKFEYKIDPKKLCAWTLASIDSNFLSSLNAIVILGSEYDEETDSDEDFYYLRNYSNEFYGELEGCDLPNDMQDGPLGLTWWAFNKIFVHLGRIHQIVEEMIANGEIEEYEKAEEINYGILGTLAHEIRHLAQNNPYIPEDIFQQEGDDEEDAEEYGRYITDMYFRNVLM